MKIDENLPEKENEDHEVDPLIEEKEETEKERKNNRRKKNHLKPLQR